MWESSDTHYGTGEEADPVQWGHYKVTEFYNKADLDIFRMDKARVQQRANELGVCVEWQDGSIIEPQKRVASVSGDRRSMLLLQCQPVVQLAKKEKYE